MLRAMAKVDAHHHLWDLRAVHYPWLTDRREPRTYGDYSAMCRDYLVEDFRRDSGPHNVVKSVHVQAIAADPLAETRWVQAQADRAGLPSAIVAHVDLTADDAAAQLDRHGESPNLRGVRMILAHLSESDSERPEHILASPAFERGLTALARRGLSFDLQVFAKQMRPAAELARRLPQLGFVLTHTGLPHDRSEAGIAAWRAGMQALAGCENLHVKLSGPGMVMPDWSAASFGPFFREAIELFGPERCMFASNVPPDGLFRSYDSIMGEFYAFAAPYGADEQAALFRGTAERFYRI